MYGPSGPTANNLRIVFHHPYYIIVVLHSPVVGVLLPADCLVGVGVQVAGLVHHLAQACLHHNHLPGLNILPTNNKSGLVNKNQPFGENKFTAIHYQS